MTPMGWRKHRATEAKKGAICNEMAPAFNFGVRLAPAPSPTAAAAAEPAHYQEQDDGADRRIDDLENEAGTEPKAKPRKQQARDQRAGDADQNIADNAKTGAADDLAGEPARHQADE